MLTNLSKPCVTAPVAYFCDGAGFPAGARGVVAGRLGASQSGAPYIEPIRQRRALPERPPAVGQFSNGVSGSCPSGSNSNPSAGCPDGYKALTTNCNGAVWQHGITVWRNNNYTPVFDTSYQYTLSAPTGAQAWSSTPAPRRSSSTEQVGQPPQLRLRHDGDRLATGRCPRPATRASVSTPVPAPTAPASSPRAATARPSRPGRFRPTSNGNFYVKAARTGRCMNVRGSNTYAGAVMEVDDCSIQLAARSSPSRPPSSAATPAPSAGTGGSTGTPAARAAAPDVLLVATYRMVPRNATGESIDVSYGSQNNGTAVQQYGSSATPSQAFYLLRAAATGRSP